jgi:hypothetical protein
MVVRPCHKTLVKSQFGGGGCVAVHDGKCGLKNATADFGGHVNGGLLLFGSFKRHRLKYILVLARKAPCWNRANG